MKRLLYISASALFLISSCSKPSSTQTMEQGEKYIFFSQDVDTKASLIESAKDMGQFGVVGFKYDKLTDWDSYKTTNPTPNVFYGNNKELVAVETLICNEDYTASYEPLQVWSSTMKYAFFAYYPIDSEYVQFGYADDGTPVIEYIMDSDNPTDSMVDVMIATVSPDYKDLYWYASDDNNIGNSTNIKFTFHHCLSSLGLNITNSTAGRILINSVSMEISNLLYQKVVIPLEEGSTKTYVGNRTSITAELELGENGTEVSSTETQGYELTDKILLIPQSDNIDINNIDINMTIGYTRIFEGYEDLTDEVKLPSVTTSLEEGKKYLVYIEFTDSNVEVKRIEGGEWDVQEPVEDTFN